VILPAHTHTHTHTHADVICCLSGSYGLQCEQQLLSNQRVIAETKLHRGATTARVDDLYYPKKQQQQQQIMSSWQQRHALTTRQINHANHNRGQRRLSAGISNLCLHRYTETHTHTHTHTHTLSHTKIWSQLFSRATTPSPRWMCRCYRLRWLLNL